MFGLPVGSISEPITTSDATVIVRVVERDDVTPEELLLGKDAFREQFLGERRTRFFAAYMAKAKERMRIEIKQDVVTRMLAETASAGGPRLVPRTRPLSLTPPTAQFPRATSQTQTASAPAARRAGTSGLAR